MDEPAGGTPPAGQPYEQLLPVQARLTEDRPTIRTYHEERFADLPDAAADVEISLVLLETLHARWVLLLRGIDDAGWARAIFHPDFGEMSLDSLLAFYAWHGAHHIAHITELRRRKGW